MMLSLDYVQRLRDRLVENEPSACTPITSVTGVHALRVHLKRSLPRVSFYFTAYKELRFGKAAMVFVERKQIRIVHVRVEGEDRVAAPLDAAALQATPEGDDWIPWFDFPVGTFGWQRPLEICFELMDEVNDAALDLLLISERIDDRNCH